MKWAQKHAKCLILRGFGITCRPIGEKNRQLTVCGLPKTIKAIWSECCWDAFNHISGGQVAKPSWFSGMSTPAHVGQALCCDLAFCAPDQAMARKPAETLIYDLFIGRSCLPKNS